MQPQASHQLPQQPPQVSQNPVSLTQAEISQLAQVLANVNPNKDQPSNAASVEHRTLERLSAYPTPSTIPHHIHGGGNGYLATSPFETLLRFQHQPPQQLNQTYLQTLLSQVNATSSSGGMPNSTPCFGGGPQGCSSNGATIAATQSMPSSAFHTPKISFQSRFNHQPSFMSQQGSQIMPQIQSPLILYHQNSGNLPKVISPMIVQQRQPQTAPSDLSLNFAQKVGPENLGPQNQSSQVSEEISRSYWQKNSIPRILVILYFNLFCISSISCRLQPYQL